MNRGSAVSRLRLLPLDEPEDHAALVAWLCAARWPFHGTTDLTPAEVEHRIRKGAYSNDTTQTFWLVQRDNAERVGLVSLQELDDLTPIFDLRLQDASRGRGLSGDALALIAHQVFDVHGKPRVEGHTRVDNTPMRRAFLKAGWVKEAHHRCAWPGDHGQLYDAVTYALLRTDWERGTRTPVPFSDEP